jgi:RecB family exonuclease
MRISYSAYSTYKQCPLQYKFSYIDRLPKKESHHLFFGSLVHEALHFMLKDINVRKLDDILDFYERKWDSRLFNEAKEDPVAWQHKGRAIITAFHQQFDPQKQEVLVVEDFFAVPLDDKHQLSGVIDRLDKKRNIHGEEALEIIDYKTGKVESQSHIHENIQLTAYYYAIKSRFPNVKDIQLTLYFLDPQIKRSTMRDAGHVDIMKQTLVDTIGKIEKQQFEPQIGPLCPWCDYKEICPAYAKEQAKRNWPKIDPARQAVLDQALRQKGSGPISIGIKTKQSSPRLISDTKNSGTQASLF